MNELATPKQIAYIEKLMRECGYDEQDLDINLGRITKMEASRLIDELRQEVGWSE